MGSKVFNLNEAVQWFLENRTGVLCVDGNREKFCNTYPEAVDFYNNKAG